MGKKTLKNRPAPEQWKPFSLRLSSCRCASLVKHNETMTDAMKTASIFAGRFGAFFFSHIYNKYVILKMNYLIDLV